MDQAIFPVVHLYYKMDWSYRTDFDRLGAGSFASVFAWHSRGSVVLKQAAQPQHTDLLKEEFAALCSMHEKYDPGSGDDFKLPHPCRYFDTYWDFAKTYKLDRNIERGLSGPSALYTMERMWPVPPALADTIRSSYFPFAGRRSGGGGTTEPDEAPSFIARLYLGKQLRQRPAVTRFFNHNNFQLDAARLRELGLSDKAIAAAMGRALAKLHFACDVDAGDVEFILGGDPHEPYDRTYLAIIDFNQVKPLGVGEQPEGDWIARAVGAVARNDPYIPRPGVGGVGGDELWESFTAAYRSQADQLGFEMHASVFLATLKEKWT